jgi:hypothetical protein
MGSLYVSEYRDCRLDWVKVMPSLRIHHPCDQPRARDCNHWKQLEAKSFDEAINEFDKQGYILKARQYMIDLVLGLQDGWLHSLIIDYDYNNTALATVDFVPYECVPMQRRVFQHALQARAKLVDGLEELAQDYPLAGEWLDLIGEDTVKQIVDEIDDFERELLSQTKANHYENETTRGEGTSKLKVYKANTDYDDWADVYLSGEGQDDYNSRQHYEDCKNLFAQGTKQIEHALIKSRVHLLEGSLGNELRETYEIV